MKFASLKTRCASVFLLCGLSLSARAAIIVNGSFESAFAGWTRADQLGSQGTFLTQTGTTSPLSGSAVPAPPSGTTAAMTDASGPGSHVLYQDFAVTGGLTTYSLGFSIFVNNTGGTFYTPATLGFGTVPNQRARVDIMKSSADPFSMASSDILLNLFETAVGGPAVFGYTSIDADVTTLFQASQGAILRLRFAEVDNVAPFNLGVDNVDVRVGGAAAVPDTLPASLPMLVLAAVSLAGAIQRRRVLREVG